MAGYDLTREPWIPVLDQGGGLRHVGLRDALVEAHGLREIYTDSPIEVAALNRLLLALAIRIFPETAEEDDWLERWRAGMFDPAPIDAYFERWRERFDLLDPKRPFYQHPEPMVSKASAISKLFNEEASGNNATLFSHVFDEQPRHIDLASAARGIVATQAAAIGGGVSKPFNLSHAPLIAGALFWMRGHSLFEALMLNAPPSCRMGDPKADDRPAWERELKTPARRVPDGYLDYLTWQSRLLLLECEESDDGRVVATGLRISQGDKEISGREDAPGIVDDPLMAYRQSKDKGLFAYRVNADRALWRDAGLFFSLFKADSGGGPRTFQWVADEEDRLNQRCWMVDVFGMATDQAKIELWRRERLPLYTPYLHQDRNRWVQLEGSLEMANEHAGTLHRACEILGSYLLFPAKDGALSQIERAEAATFARALDAVDRFWAALEVPFGHLLAELATTDDIDRSVEKWRGTLGRLALDAFGRATSSLTTTARHLRALAHAEHYLLRRTRFNTTNNHTL